VQLAGHESYAHGNPRENDPITLFITVCDELVTPASRVKSAICVPRIAGLCQTRLSLHSRQFLRLGSLTRWQMPS
jgi:hypothetical protein